MTEALIQLSIRPDIIGKPTDRQLLATLKEGWKQHTIKRPAELLHLLAKKGFAVAPGIYRDGVKTKEAFIHGQVYLADFDGTMTIEEATHNEYIRNHFIGLYTTCSHGAGKGDRFRAVGIFPKPLTTPAEYDAAVRAIRQQLPGQDPAMNCAQASFGNPDSNIVAFDEDNLLPLPTTAQQVDRPQAPEINQADRRKALACLEVIQPRGPKGSGTYPDAISAVMALVNEFGPDEALAIIDEAGWHDPGAEDWELESKIRSVEIYPSSNGVGLGTLITIARRHAAQDPAFAAKLERTLAERTSQASGEEQLQRLMTELLDVSCDVENPHRWAKAKLIEAEIKKLGVSPREIQRQKMAMLSARLGLDTAGVNGVRNSIRKLGRNRDSTAHQWLLPNFLPKAKAAMLYGDSGVGKTAIALHIGNAYINSLPFADSVYPAVSDGRKVLFVASDGQGDAHDHLTDFAEQSGFVDDDKFYDLFDVYSANETSGPFNFTEAHLVNLHQKLQSGEYGLVFIDSLKAACMGSDFSIDDRTAAEPMRVVQAMCAKTETTLVWLHHTNKSSSGSSHRAGGSTDVIEIVSAVHELRHTWDDKSKSEINEWIVQKLRGSSKRRFSYTFDFETGVVPDEAEPEPASNGELILRAIYESEFKRLSRQSVAKRLDKNPKTLGNHATHLKSEGLLKMHGTAWELTKQGTVKAKQLPPLPSFFPSSSDF